MKKVQRVILDFINLSPSKNDQDLKSFLIKNSGSSFLLRLGEIGLALITSILLARFLGPEGLGEYSYVLALITIIVIPTQLGLPQLLVREIAAYVAKKEWGLIGGILIRANQLVIILSIFFSIIIAFLLVTNHSVFQHIDNKVVWWAIPLLLLLPLNSLRTSALRGYKEINLGLIPEYVIKPVSFIILFIGFYFAFKNTVQPGEAMLITSISTFIAFLVGAYWLKRKTPETVFQTKKEFRSKVWVKSTLPFALLGGIAIINSKIDIVLLGWLSTTENVGLYQVASRGAGFVAISLGVVNMVVSPIFSELWAKKDIKMLQKVVTKSSLAIMIISLFIACILIVFGEILLQTIFGDEYVASYTALALLCIGYLFNAMMGSVGQLLNMTGYEIQTAFGITISAVSNIILNYLLIPQYGIEGAAVASIISFFLWNCFLGWQVYKKLNIIPSIFKISLILK